ncbi:unnamed protein product [Caenorhabditis brenneri]
MPVPEFEKIVGEVYHTQFANDSILNIDVDEQRTSKLLSKNDNACLKRLVVKFRFHLKEGHENIEKYKKGDILLDHAIFISDLMIKRTVDLQNVAKHEKDKNRRSENFMVIVSLFKKGLIAFERQQEQLRRHLARLAFANTEEGAAYFKKQARDELEILIRERVELYKKKQAELEGQPKPKIAKNGMTGIKEETEEEITVENLELKSEEEEPKEKPEEGEKKDVEAKSD